MATIFNETYEAAGYDNVWNGAPANVTGGNTYDPDYATAISGWGSKCLQVVAAADSTNAYIYHELAANQAITYTRIEVYPTDLSGFATGEDALILQMYNKSWTLVYAIYIYNNAGTNYFRIRSRYNASDNYFLSDNSIAINTKYTIEVYWDNTNDLWSWRVDGVDQGDGTAVSADYSCGIFVVGVQGGYKASYLADSFNINSDGFLGPTGAGVASIEVQAIG